MEADDLADLASDGEVADSPPSDDMAELVGLGLPPAVEDDLVDLVELGGGSGARVARRVCAEEPSARRKAAASADFARRVKECYRKRKALEQAMAPPSVPAISFHTYADHANQQFSLTSEDIDQILWARGSTVTTRSHCTALGLRHEQLQKVVSTTMWRYVQHRQQVLEDAVAPKVFPGQIVSLRVKWDETQQVVCDRSQTDQSRSSRATSLTTNVMVLTCWVKTPRFRLPQLWSCPLQKLQRNTADAMWVAFTQHLPFGPFDRDASRLPGPGAALWLLFVFCSDDASSNRRLTAHMERCLLGCRPRVLVVTVKCLVHALHRTAVPLITRGGLVGSLYRAAHILCVASYWRAMMNSFDGFLRRCLVVTHHAQQSAADRDIAQQILELVFCNGMPMASASDQLRTFLEHVLDKLPGDWGSSNIVFMCSPSCAGGEACRQKALAEVRSIVSRLLFSSKMSIPVGSRWWKFTPAAKKALIGCALHGIFSRCAPTNHNAAQAPGDAEAGVPDPDAVLLGADGDDTEWHLRHGFRVRKTFEFFAAPSTIPRLLSTLLALRPTHLIMAHLMAHDSRILGDAVSNSADAAGRFYGQGLHFHAGKTLASRAKPVIDFVSPATSPVWQALALAERMLRPDGSNKSWESLKHFWHGTPSEMIAEIWDCLLPAAGRIWWRVRKCVVEAWPLKLALLLTGVPDLEDQAAEEFADLKPCCCPRGLRPLLQETSSAEDCKAPWFKNIVVEMMTQIDLSIFDVEISHHVVRSLIEEACGRAPGIAALSLMHMAAQTASAFQHLQASGIRSVGKLSRFLLFCHTLVSFIALLTRCTSVAFPLFVFSELVCRWRPKPVNCQSSCQQFAPLALPRLKAKPVQRKRGRPLSSRPKRRRFDGWNAFVQKHPPSAQGALAIKQKGEDGHMAQLGRKWRALSDAERAAYHSLAAATLQEIPDPKFEGDSEDEQNEADVGADVNLSPWGLGSAAGPLRPDLVGTPAFDRDVSQKVDSWTSSLSSEIMHSEQLPRQVLYDDACIPGCCKTEEHRRLGLDMLRALHRSPCRLLTVFALRVNSEASDSCSVVMLVHTHGGQNKEWILLSLRPLGLTSQFELNHGIGFPWHLQLERLPDASTREQHLRFVHDANLMVNIAEMASDMDATSVLCEILEYRPTSLNTLVVDGIASSSALYGSEFKDMRDIAEDAEEWRQDLDEIAAPANVGAGRLPPPPTAGDRQDDESAGDEYELDPETRACVEEAHTQMAALDLHLRAVGGADAGHGDAGVPLAPAASEPDDLSGYDMYIEDGPGNLSNVRRNGERIGQLQGFPQAYPYTVAMRCFFHDKCSRMRTHKPGRGESIQHVDRVLTHWLVSGQHLSSAAEHMRLCRL